MIPIIVYNCSEMTPSVFGGFFKIDPLCRRTGVSSLESRRSISAINQKIRLQLETSGQICNLCVWKPLPKYLSWKQGWTCWGGWA